MAKERTWFCVECREETTYRIQRVLCPKSIKGKEYVFEVSEAVCDKCGGPVNIPGLMDSNAQEIDRQYRLQEGLVGVEDIHKPAFMADRLNENPDKKGENPSQPA